MLIKLVLLANFIFPSHGQTLSDKLGRVVDQCKKVKSDKMVWVFKQWHLSPSDNTKENPNKNYPQKENQRAIFQQLDQWVEEDKVKVVFAEGCGGEIDSHFAEKFNGWTMEDLIQEAKSENYSKIISHAPMMIEAKYGEKVKTVCGDDTQLVNAQNLQFSDLRAATGFLTRLEDYENRRDKEKPYLQAVIQAYKLKKHTTGDGARAYLKREIKKIISQIEKGIDKRNQSFVNTIIKTSTYPSVVVIGGIHAKPLKKLLENKKLNCEIAEFKGYDYDDEELLRKLKSYFK